MKLTICNRASTRNEMFAIHATGCPDIARREVRENAAQLTHITVDSITDALANVLDPDMVEMGYGPEHVRIFPCCLKA